ncbi:ABC transporter ATP-binding protein [Halonatronum saccharophilum]|uniref:ABC transporter ATP-binding protein n=1 Tax=Halonatronum saccharophilum TaxID=150060 RepID=UPI0004882144|nr:ABC transporter ATP-binding protein [Halonatronum saccharophilum]
MVEISIKNLKKTFKNDTVLKGINLKVNKGEMVALLGPSGCGKTTTLKIIAGLEGEDSGEVYFDKDPVLNIPTQKRGAVMVFQDYLLFPHMTVEENIGFGLKMAGYNKRYRRERVDELLSMIGLSKYKSNYPKELSGGQKQRVALARALAIKPKVLLLDEPLSNLDANLRKDMQKLIKKLHQKEGMTTIFVTHDREEAMLMGDKIAIMNKGMVLQYGSGEDLYLKPNSKFVADFLGEANYLNATLKGDNILLKDLDKEVPSTEDKPIAKEDLIAMIRPEMVEILSSNEDLSDNKEYIYLNSRVKSKEFAGERTYYQLAINNNLTIKAISLLKKSFALEEEVKARVEVKNISFLERD